MPKCKLPKMKFKFLKRIKTFLRKSTQKRVRNVTLADTTENKRVKMLMLIL